MSFDTEGDSLKEYKEENDKYIVEIPEGIKHIGRFCFHSSYHIRKIILPDTIKKIDRFAFSSCKNLSDINIPFSVSIIDDYAFSDCESLKYIYIPESVKFIGDNIFSGCCNLKKIDISEKNQNYRIIDNVLFSYNMSNLLSYSGSETNKYYIVPEEVSRIGGSAFEKSMIERINLPKYLDIIEHLAFSDCRNLKEIKISKNVTVLNSMTFMNCISLKSIDIPLSVKNIRNYCFDNCTSLETIKMPFDIEIDENSFMHCSSIKNLTLFDKRFSFSVHTEKNIRYSDMKKLLAFFKSNLSEENFSLIKRADFKIPVALFMLCNFENDFFISYIKRNIRKAVKILTDENNLITLRKIFHLKLIEKKHISEMIEYAESTGKINIKNMLEVYRIQNKL